jgi:predicted PurR-regulated permease PerM
VPDTTSLTRRWSLIALRVWAIIGIVVLIVGALWLLARISLVLTPFIFAALVVFVLRRPVDELASKGLSRGLAVTFCYIVSAAILTFVGIFIVPPLVSQFRDFLDDFPRYYTAARDLWFNLQREYTNLEVPQWVQDAAMASRETIARQIALWSRSVAGIVVTLGGQLFSFVFNLFLSLALAFFVLRDLPTLRSEVLILGGKRQGDVSEVIARITFVVEGWIRGQSIIAVIVGVMTWLGLQVLGVPYALIIGLIAGVTNLIPYLGPFVGGIIAAISASFVSPALVLYTVAYIAVIQQMESLFLQPRVMSDQVHLHPVLVVFSLLIGAMVAGLVGMLFAVPVAGVINTIFVYYFEKNTDSTLATADGAMFRRSTCDDSHEECVDEPVEAADDGTEDEERT